MINIFKWVPKITTYDGEPCIKFVSIFTEKIIFYRYIL